MKRKMAAAALAVAMAYGLEAADSALEWQILVENAKQAPTDKRREAMNRLKRKLAAMDRQQQREAISQMTTLMAASRPVGMESVLQFQQATNINRLYENETAGMKEAVSRYMDSVPKTVVPFEPQAGNGAPQQIAPTPAQPTQPSPQPVTPPASAPSQPSPQPVTQPAPTPAQPSQPTNVADAVFGGADRTVRN